MTTKYPANFEKALDHAMGYEVGGFWNVNNPAVASGNISTPAARKAVGYVNDPDDRGGETKFGIAKSANPNVNITTLTWAQAQQIYYDKYWVAGKCDLLPEKVAIMQFDACVNMGVGRANKFLQTAVGAVADGIIGPKTIAAIKAYASNNLLSSYAQQRRNFYEAIVRNNSSQAKFLKGWLRRVNEVETYAKEN